MSAHAPDTAVADEAGGVADVILRDGRTLRLRPPEHGDRDGLAAFLAGLSPDSLHQRFHAAVRPRADLVDPYLDSNWAERGALLAAITDGGGEQIIALASYTRLRDRSAAEAAFAVADAFQALGIATRMLEQLAQRANAEGIERLVFEILPGNGHMLRVVADAGFEVTRRTANGVVEATMLIEPTGASLLRMDERDHAGVTASLRGFLDPRSVAVYGASARRGTIGGELYRNILAGGFTGRVLPLNRRAESVDGVPARQSLRGGSAPPFDLAVICVPAAAVADAATDALEAGVRSLCVVSAGFAEIGAAGAARQESLVALVRSYGGRLIGPNCLGIASTGSRLSATFAAQPLPPGGVGFASQSGALGLAVVEQARDRGLGLSAFVSLGNKADVSSNDLLEHWEDDEATSVVALYLESFGNPLRFARVARRVARRKPVLALKGGATAGARAAASHAAALASSEVAVDALFRQSGVQRARTLSEFLDAAALLSSQPLPRGPRVAVLTNAGGLAILCADACAAEGLELPPPSAETRAALRDVVPAEAGLGNPIDVLGSASAETFAAALPSTRRSGVRRRLRAVRAADRHGRRRRRARDRRRDRPGRARQAGRGDFLNERGLDTEQPTRVARFESPEAAAGRSAWRPGERRGCAGPKA